MAMLRGWVAAGVASSCVVVEPTGVPAALESAAGIVWYSSPAELPTELRPDAVVFAVKPQIADEVVPNYRSWAAPETLFMSIVAGKTLAGLARHLGRAAIVRTMPNTPAAIGRGITVACANPLVTIGQRQLCDRLLAAIGESAWVEDEALMDVGHGGLRQRPCIRVPADRSARCARGKPKVCPPIWPCGWPAPPLRDRGSWPAFR